MLLFGCTLHQTRVGTQRAPSTEEVSAASTTNAAEAASTDLAAPPTSAAPASNGIVMGATAGANDLPPDFAITPPAPPELTDIVLPPPSTETADLPTSALETTAQPSLGASTVAAPTNAWSLFTQAAANTLQAQSGNVTVTAAVSLNVTSGAVLDVTAAPDTAETPAQLLTIAAAVTDMALTTVPPAAAGGDVAATEEATAQPTSADVYAFAGRHAAVVHAHACIQCGCAACRRKQ
jgi:hypothetical protein